MSETLSDHDVVQNIQNFLSQAFSNPNLQANLFSFSSGTPPHIHSLSIYYRNFWSLIKENWFACIASLRTSLILIGRQADILTVLDFFFQNKQMKMEFVPFVIFPFEWKSLKAVAKSSFIVSNVLGRNHGKTIGAQALSACSEKTTSLISSKRKRLSVQLALPKLRTSHAYWRTKLSNNEPWYIKIHRKSLSPFNFCFVFCGVTIYAQNHYFIRIFLPIAYPWKILCLHVVLTI